MKLISAICLLMLLGLQAMPAKEPTPPPVYLQPASYPITQLLPPYPRPGSKEEKADFAEFDAIRANISPADLARASQEEKDSVFDFSEVLGAQFNAAALPKTAALMEQVTLDTKASIKTAKLIFLRPRPPTAGEKDGKEKDYSYPSGHATRAFVWASLLADLFPESRDALFKQAAQKGRDRVILGKHYPADIVAGEIYGKFLAGQLLKNHEFQKQWIIVKAEITEKLGIVSEKSR